MKATLATAALLTAALTAAGSGLALVEAVGSLHAFALSSVTHAGEFAEQAGDADAAAGFALDRAAQGMADGHALLNDQGHRALVPTAALAQVLVGNAIYAKVQGEWCALDPLSSAVDAAADHDAEGAVDAYAAAVPCEASMLTGVALGTQAALVAYGNGLVAL